MSLSKESTKYVESIATESLDKFKTISHAAKDWLNAKHQLGSDSLASVNTMTSSAAVQRLEDISQINRTGYDRLAKEPAIARVVVEDELGARQTYYFCRADQGMPGLGVISYRAPIGRLASLPVGEEYQRPDGHEVFVVERTRLRPSERADGWDSWDSVVESEEFTPITIESLRELLAGVVGEDATEDLLRQ